MTAPADLTNLRSMIDGDKEVERLLFEEFISSFEAGITNLQARHGANGSEGWCGEAHALKGIAVNVGAMKLGDLCKKAQDSPLADVAAKEGMLTQIRTEYQRVHEFLLSQM